MAAPKHKYNWTPRKRNYQQEWEQVLKPWSKSLAENQHPLGVVLSKPQPEKSTAEKFVDPLADSDNVTDDPLSNATSNDKPVSLTQVITGQLNLKTKKQKNDFLNWSLKKNAYLKRYTTDKNIPVVSKIVLDEEGAQVVTLDDRVKMRMEQLEKDAKSDMSYMTQQECINHLEKLNEDLRTHWNNNDRVAALKIVIKCTKIMAMNTVPSFYPSLFVLVAQVLDQFGELVFIRIKDKACDKDPVTGKCKLKLGDNFLPHDISDDAKEICRNWFYKVASIRELVARVYVEMSIIGCNKFLFNDRKRLIADFERIAKTIRGIGDPLVAGYARLYLARRGVELIPEEKTYLLSMLEDFFKCWQNQTGEGSKFLKDSGLDSNGYYQLFLPILEWLLEAVGNGSSEKVFKDTVEKYQSSYNITMLLNFIINGFDAPVIAKNALRLIALIKQADDASMPRYLVYKTLGEKFVLCSPDNQDKMKLLNAIWQDVSTVTDIPEYVKVVEVYIEFVIKNFSLKETNILLSDLRKHLAVAQSVEKMEGELKHVLLTILENTKDFIDVFNMEHFLPIFDMLKSSSQIEVSKGMLVAFGKRERLAADPVLVNALFDLAKTVHDSVNTLSEEKEKMEVSQLLVNFINKIDFGTSFEKQLNFFVECRRSLSSFDAVKEALTMQVLQMVAKTYDFVKGKHTKKTFEFVKACMAFVHITIPSIDSIFTRLYLYVLSGQVSLMNNLLGQADVLFKIAIETIAEVPTLIMLENQTAIPTEVELVTFVNYLASCFISIPSHPDLGPFYLFRGLLNILQNYSWAKGSDGKIRIYVNMLNSLCALYQESLPYTYVGVNSNDTLFAGDVAYFEDICTIGNTLVEEILKHMATLSEDEDVSTLRKQAMSSMDVFNHLVSQCDLNPQSTALAARLYGLAQKNADKNIETFTKNSLSNLKRSYAKDSLQAQLYNKLATTAQ